MLLCVARVTFADKGRNSVFFRERGSTLCGEGKTREPSTTMSREWVLEIEDFCSNGELRNGRIEDSVRSRNLRIEDSVGPKNSRIEDSVRSNNLRIEDSIGSKNLKIEDSVGSRNLRIEDSVQLKVV